ncbi:hypothetical protein RhiirA4_477083 [Rhizophagus irregularis]|uniref:Uncharacterized protein n=1 Tax=Rhizophagus irregularis TaxID=588596 RepID=A0A2I1HCN6_9GLOM|nr:hypothetical protein RhiirA4_477083 [Rhizophagus irregularis]
MKADDDIQDEYNGREQDPNGKASRNISINTQFSSTTRESFDISSGDDHKNEENNEGNPITDEEVYKFIESKVDERNKLRLENEELKKENSSLRETIESYQKNYTNELESQRQRYENNIKKYELRIQELNQKLNDSNKELGNYKEYTETFKTELKEIQTELDIKNKDIIELKTNNASLKEEASKYQSALGVAANFRISDDMNHSVQLKNDILSLQDIIENYVTNLKGKIEVNIENVKRLSENYGCHTNIMEKADKQNKSFIKAILQRHVLDEINRCAKKYFDCSGSVATLESEILMKTVGLCSKLNEFSKTRKGTDTITPASSIKVRQEVCVALSNRGFSEVIEDNQAIDHNFIVYAKQVLNKSLDEYRIINDPVKKQSVENMATNLIREFIKIFWFRLRIQEPVITADLVGPDKKIDPNAMTGRWEGEEENINNLVVDLCYFPMIGLNLNDPSKRQLYTRAKVFPRRQSYADSIMNIMKTAITTNKSESSTQREGYDFNEVNRASQSDDQNREQT